MQWGLNWLEATVMGITAIILDFVIFPILLSTTGGRDLITTCMLWCGSALATHVLAIIGGYLSVKFVYPAIGFRFGRR